MSASGVPSRSLVTSANRSFYASTAAQYDAKGKGATVQLAQDNARAILDRVPGIDAGGFDVMDYAAGTGLIAMLLSPRVRSITAVDLSPEMIGVLQSKLDAQPAEARIDNVHPIAADLLDSVPSQLQSRRFDLVTCTMAYHHFADPVNVTQVLAGFVKQGGYFAVVDLVKADKDLSYEHQHDHHHHHHHGEHGEHGHQHHHPHSDTHQGGAKEMLPPKEHVVAHKHGFSQHDIEGFLAPAGLELVEMRNASRFFLRDQHWDVFLAIARKP
ncbi:hypothetical protein ACQY0O_004200 [Thecaphora frezii]